MKLGRIFSFYFHANLNLGLNGKTYSIPAAVIVSLVWASIITAVFFQHVQLKPEIGANFFFSSDDPQMQDDARIQKMFSQEAQLIFNAKGNIETPEYQTNIKSFSGDLAALPEVISVVSLSSGPGTFLKAQEGPFWNRVLLSDDGQSTLLSVFIRDIEPEEFILKIENIIARHNAPQFALQVSGEPYIVEQLRRGLYRDLKRFSLAAVLLFGSLFLFFFQSFRILLGAMSVCTGASMLTLITSQAVHVETGPLTANLSTIIFVVTLSHIIFIIFNHRTLMKKISEAGAEHRAVTAMKITLPASFWSMATTVLGFLSLFLVKAMPLRQLGAAGALGTGIAFIAAYLFFPPFLKDIHKPAADTTPIEKHDRKIEPFFYRKHHLLFWVLAVSAFVLAFGIFRIKTDPSLLEYFKKGGELRDGLEYIDRNGGSSPLFMVVKNPESGFFNDKKSFEKLWETTLALEENPEVGSAVSLPILMAQAHTNPLARFLTIEWLLDLMESKRFGEVAKYFITPDRSHSLIMLRMREARRHEPRVEILKQISGIVRQTGLDLVLTGGIYSLQGRMAELIASSLLSGMVLLLGTFVAMVWFLSHSARLTLAMFFGLCMIPSIIYGILGFSGIPVDIISAPAANIAISISVDSMIHMLLFVCRTRPAEKTAWKSWKLAAVQYWKPVTFTALVIGSGFGIFALSDFPPTQRFGIMVVMGTFMAPFATLIALAFLASFQWKNIFRKPKSVSP